MMFEVYLVNKSDTRRPTKIRISLSDVVDGSISIIIIQSIQQNMDNKVTISYI